MPADITGTDFIEKNPATGSFELLFRPGSVVLQHGVGRRNQPDAAADASRAPRGHARGGEMSVGRVRHKLANPSSCAATQNPIEQEGTYPLPEPQQDRFMFKVYVHYPKFNEELGNRLAARPASRPTKSPRF